LKANQLSYSPHISNFSLQDLKTLDSNSQQDQIQSDKLLKHYHLFESDLKVKVLLPLVHQGKIGTMTN